MPKALYFVFVVCSLLSSTCFAGEYIIKIDRATGQFVKQGPAIPGITWVIVDDRAYDHRNGTFIFPSHLVTRSLYSMDVSNGAVINSPLLGDVAWLQFDNTFGTLYGIEQQTAANTKQFVSIDPVTGATTAIGSPLPGSAMVVGNFFTYDQKNHIYYFLDPPGTIVGIDVTTGAIASSAMLTMPFGESLNAFAYDSTNACMYAIVGNGITNWYFLSKINPLTGSVNHLGWGTNHIRHNGRVTIDEANQQFIAVYTSQDSGGYMIATMDIATGDLLHNKLVLPFKPGGDNVFSIKCDNATSELYAIHWESETTAIPATLSENRSVVYPNPVRGSATIQCSNPNGEERRLELYNAVGQIQLVVEHIITDKVQICTEDLPAGIYYYRLETSKRIVASGRMVIE